MKVVNMVLMVCMLWLAACSPPVDPSPVSQGPTTVATMPPEGPRPEVDAPTTAANGGQPAAPQPTPPGTDPTSPAAVEPTPFVPPPPPSKTLLVTTDDGGPALAFLQQVAQEWSATSGWTVTITPKDPAALRLDFEMAALADQAPDLVLTGSDAIVPLVAGNLLQPVGEWFAAPKFAPPVVDAAKLDGTQWGVPLSAEGQLMLLYNRKLIGAPPATSDDLLRTPKPEAASATLVTNLNDPRWLLPWLIGFGGRVLGDDLRPSLNTPETVATYTFLRQLRSDNVNPEIDFAEGSDLFKQGQAAMIIDGDWTIPWYLDAAANAPDTLELGVAPLPIVSGTNRPATPYVGGRYVLVSGTVEGEKQAMARSFVDYLTSADVQGRLAGSLRRLPARMETLQSEVVQNDALLKPQADSLANALPTPTQPQYAAIWNALGSRTGAVMTGEVPPQTAAEEIQSAAEAALGQ